MGVVGAADVILCVELTVWGELKPKKKKKGLHLSAWATLKWPSVGID